MSIGVNLALRNEAQLEAFIAQVSDHKSPNYGHYLTPDQFAATYGPAQAQVQLVVDQLRANGLSVGSVSSNRTIVDASGPVSAVEAAFGVTISDWHDRDQNRDFFGNDTEPTLPAAVASYVVGVAGLNNHYPLHRLGPAPRVGGGPNGGYTPNELKKAYDVTPLASAGYNGSGQRLGLFELDGFRQSNITTYDNQYALGSPAPTTVLISGANGSPGPNEIEVELDIEVMHAIASASPITVWEGPNNDPGVNATYNAMVTSNTTKSNSTSWGICEPNTTTAEMTTLDNIFKQGAAQGQSFFAASGDYGAYDCGDNRLTVDSPANDPYMTAAGGTALTLNTDGTYKSESAWSNPNTFPTATGSGGGLSSYFARPSWQTGPGVANTDSNGKRQVPDISSDADPNTGYSVYVTNGGTGWTVVGGTSAAAPSWAAFTSVYNQYAAANGKPNLGFANPTLYSTGSHAQPYPPYHDVTTGDNLFYSATTNWDYASGWGSYDAYNFARDQTTTLAYTQSPQGNWVGTYGADGYALPAWNGATDLSSLPQSTLVVDQGARAQWNVGTSDARALQSPDGTTRRAATLFDNNQLRLHLNFSAAYTGTLHLYALDWDTTARRETVTINDGSGPRTATISSAFDQGAWVAASINVTAGGSLTITVTPSAGANAVLSGVFLGGSPSLPVAPTQLTATAASSSQISLAWTGSAHATGYKVQRSPDSATWAQITSIVVTSFSDVGLNPSTTYYYRVLANNTAGDSSPSNVVAASTSAGLGYMQAPQGNWVGAYGADGYALFAWNGSTDVTALPQSTLVVDQGARAQWNVGTSDARALQSPDGTTRRAATLFDNNQLRLHLNFSAAYTGTLHLYALDWDTTARRETVTINDGSGPRTATISSAFDQGAWVAASINVTAGGSLTITVTPSAGANAVLSGVFLS